MQRRTFLTQASLFVGAAVTGAVPKIVHATTRSIDPLIPHIINRLTGGIAPESIVQVQSMGIDRYIEMQLNPANIPLTEELETRLAQFSSLQVSAGDMVALYRGPVEGGDREAKQKVLQAQGRKILQESSQARVLQALGSPRQLEMVLTDFWFNHFNVFANKGQVKLWLGSYEREAIRPHVLGKFRDLLGATAHHPAMLFYLDNWQSSRQGLNENYARELMELHTLGVDGGYSQADVISLAKVLTGWGLAAYNRPTESGFFFSAQRHEPGVKTLLGKALRKTGEAQGEEALDRLASHPATAKFIGFKLAQYFVGDRPPQRLVKQLQARFLETQGDLRLVLGTLFGSEDFWDPKHYGRKYKTPYQYVISALRATGVAIDKPQVIVGLLQQFSMGIYGCPTPDGYKQVESAWLNPDGMVRRLNFAINLGSGRSGVAAQTSSIDPAVLQETLGPLLKAKSKTEIARQPANLRSGLMLGSPEFMYR
jgi:uncharacterized protein (DUF1800 family)